MNQIYLESQEAKTYMIPVYQRNYAWEEEEITALIKDVYDSACKDSKAPYYIGTLVTFKRGDSEYEVNGWGLAEVKITAFKSLLHFGHLVRCRKCLKR